MASPYAPLPLAVSIGEPAGIGADVILAAWNNARRAEKENILPPFILLCDSDHLATRARALNVNVPVTICDHPDDFVSACAVENFFTSLPVFPLRNRFGAAVGAPQTSDARGVIEAITTGVDLVQSGQADGLVTLPINKKSLYDSGFDYPGHTEYLGYLAQKTDAAARPVMMLAGPKLRAIPVTIHIPLKDVPSQLTTQLIIETATIAARDLSAKFGISSPRLAIAGLNPHAGENGSLGTEDETIIKPAIEALQAAGINCVGPLPADTMFHDAARAKYDVALCMYHDQALIPAKALGFDDSVNVTLGLPFIRTSPDHGTAFDIAGTGKANPASTIAALRMAAEMAKHMAKAS